MLRNRITLWTCRALAVTSMSVLSACSGGGGSSHSTSAAPQPAGTTTRIAASSASVNLGDSVSVTATVTSSGAPVTSGSVTFYDGTAALASHPLSASGSAAWTGSSMPAGSHNITATYTGNSTYAASTSSSLSITVNAPRPTPAVSLSSSSSTAQQGIPVELVATVSAAASSSSMPTGTVTFTIASGTLGSSTLDGTGTATFLSTRLPVGTNSITAEYSGDATYADSISGVQPVTITAPAGATYTNPLTLNATASLKAVSCADPAILKTQSAGVNTWYLYCTSDALYAGDTRTHYINIFHSSDLLNWTYDGDALNSLPSWANISGSILWAPAIKYFNGQYYLYYATPVSTLAGNGSAIGVATSNSPAGPFVDAGKPVVEPELAGNCCAGQYRSTIDPDVVQDASGLRYILFGSWTGLYVRRLSTDGLTSDSASEQLVAADARFEGGNWWFHDGYYYLFASSTNCCNGPLTGYGVLVGRAASPMGPYLDAQGVSLTATNPGGTPALMMNGNSVLGPGGNVVFTDEAGQDYILYHGVLAASPYYPGSTTYTVRPAFLDALDWIDDWPVTRGGFGASDSSAPQPTPAAQPGQSSAYRQIAPETPNIPRTQISALSDDFTASTLSSRWSFMHGTPAYTLSADGLKLASVAADPVSNMAAVPLLAESAPPGDYIVDTKLDLDLPLSGQGPNFAQAGILLYGDDANFLRLDLYNANDTRQIEFVKAMTPQAPGYPAWGTSALSAPAIANQVTAWLRIARRTVDGEEHYAAYSSDDGLTWIQGGTWVHKLGASPRICLYAGNQPGYTATFHYLHVSTVQ